MRAALQNVQPVLHDAMDRAISLAASMDSRGYAHTRATASHGLNLMLIVSLVLAVVTGALAVLRLTDYPV